MPRLFPTTVVLCLIALPAKAHLGAVGAADVTLQDDIDGAFALQEPWGLVLGGGVDPAYWLCHELLSSPGVGVRPEFVRSPNGSMLAMTQLLSGSVIARESLYFSDDGCDWRPAGGATDLLVSVAAFHPTDPLRAIGGTSNYEIGAVENVLLLSTDGGQTFEVEQTFPGLLFRSAEFGPDGSAYAIAVSEDASTAYLLRSEDGAAPWTSAELDSSSTKGPLFPELMGIDPSDPEVLWIRFDDASTDVLLRSTDGGSSLFVVTSTPEAIVDLIPGLDGDAWITSGDRELWYAPGGSDFSPVPSPQVWGGTRQGSQLFLATDSDRELAAAVRGQSSAFETVFETLDLAGPLQCASDSQVTAVCAPLWDSLINDLELKANGLGNDDDSASEQEDERSTCDGCTSGGEASPAPGLFLLSLLAGFTLRRRS